MDNFIEKIQQIKGMMLGVSLSALILAPFAIGISLYLVTHPKFLHLVENESEFALMLMLFVTVVLVTSGIWLVTGIQQFRSLNSWNKRYCNYLKKRENLDESIVSKYHLDEE
jgi:predicted PurR-regulated permease PerM